jgi:DNA-binding response OmpR family regulator
MNLKAPTVLFIDDDIEILDMLKAMFERSSEITVQTAESAKQALEILTQKTFSVIIVDYDMPEISGIELLKILRRQGNTTPIILFTGLGGENTAIEALNNGANFLLKKGDDPQYQFRNLAELVRKIAKQGGVRRTPGSTPPMIIDMINFSSEACFSLDERGNVVAWNESMEHLTGVPAASMIGKGDQVYSEPFFGTRKKMLPNLVFETDEEIKRQKYKLISRVQNGPVIAVTRGKKNDGSDWTIWMKAMPVFDDGGNFVASVATVRDVTATFGDVITDDSAAGTAEEIPELPSPEPKKPAPGIFNKILGKPSLPAHYKQGVILFAKEKKYKEAIELFDQALAIDNNLPYVWNDRGTCLRELGDYTNALKSISKAVALDSGNPEFLFNLGEILEMMGVTNMSNKYIDSAIQTFKMVVDLMPNNASAWNHLGICFNQVGRTDESKFYFNRARDINLFKKDTPIVRKRDEIL